MSSSSESSSSDSISDVNDSDNSSTDNNSIAEVSADNDIETDTGTTVMYF